LARCFNVLYPYLRVPYSVDLNRVEQFELLFFGWWWSWCIGVFESKMAAI
jgi:hypothetical protein